MDNLLLLLNNLKKERTLPQHTENSIIDSKGIKSFQDWFYSIKLQTKKGLYKMAYFDICKNACYYNSFDETIDISVIKAIIMLKIIKRKMSKYNIDPSPINVNIISSIEQWFNKIDETLDPIIYQFYSSDNISYKQYISQIENIFNCYIDYLYLNALFYRRINKIEKTCAYIGISINVIQKSVCLITNANTLNIIEKIYLLAVNILMTNNDYSKALEYQEKVIDYCFRELIIKIDYFQGIQDCICEKKKKKHYSIIFLNISVAFCLRGICKESIGSITKSIEAYKQSKWFANKFLDESNPLYSKLINQLVERSIIYHNVISKLSQSKKTNSKSLRSIIEDQSNNEFNREKSKISKGHYINFEKFKKTEEIISNLEGGELIVPLHKKYKKKHDERSNSEYLLSNIRLLDAYRSNEFKDTLYQMKKINIGYFDIETKEYLQRIIDKITFRNDRQLDFQSSPSTKTFNDNNHKLEKSASQPNINFIKKKKEESLPSENHSKKTAKTYKIRRTHSQYLKIEQFKYAQRFFSKAFTTKKKYIEKLDTKELTFQKNLLSLKTNEKYPPAARDDLPVELRAVLTFNKLKDNASRNKSILFQTNLTHQEKKDKQKKRILESTVLKSFNLKKYNELNKVLESKNKRNMMKIMTNTINDSDRIYKERKEIDEENKETLKQINNDLCLFITHSKSPQERYSRNQYRLKHNHTNEFLIEKGGISKF